MVGGGVSHLCAFPEQHCVMQTFHHCGQHLEQSQSAATPRWGALLLLALRRHGGDGQLLFLFARRPLSQLLWRNTPQSATPPCPSTAAPFTSTTPDTPPISAWSRSRSISSCLEEVQEEGPGQVTVSELRQQVHQTLQPPLLPRQLLVQRLVLLAARHSNASQGQLSRSRRRRRNAPTCSSLWRTAWPRHHCPVRSRGTPPPPPLHPLPPAGRTAAAAPRGLRPRRRGSGTTAQRPHRGCCQRHCITVTRGLVAPYIRLMFSVQRKHLWLFGV